MKAGSIKYPHHPIAARRMELGLTAAKLGEKAGVHGNTISKIEGSHIRISPSLAQSIANAMTMSAGAVEKILSANPDKDKIYKNIYATRKKQRELERERRQIKKCK